MKKKIKNLTDSEINHICASYGCECSEGCPLYRVEQGRMRLCMNVGVDNYLKDEDYQFTPKELEKLEEEIEIKE